MGRKFKFTDPLHQTRPARWQPHGFVWAALALVGFAVSLIAPAAAWTKVEYDSTSLLILSSDQVGDIIKKNIKKAQEIQSKQEDSEDGEITAEPEAFEQLKNALRVVLARPDQDGARSTLYARVRSELADLNSVDQALVDLTEESISELRNSQDAPRRTATYVMILENIMAEIRPEVRRSPTAKKLVERIRDAKLAIKDTAKVKNLLRSMSIPVSPSLSAQKLLEKEFPPTSLKKSN